MVLGSVKIGKIITIPKAKSINYAKKQKIKYDIVKVPSISKIKRMKTKKGYQYKWKKVKTVIRKNLYNQKKKKWSVSKKKQKTAYRILTSKKKKGIYYHKKITVKGNYQCKGKGYVKVIPTFLDDWR